LLFTDIPAELNRLLLVIDEVRNKLENVNAMRLQVFSDVHNECGWNEPAVKDADVVVLAGDIHQGSDGVEWATRFFPDMPVIYVLGNHEFYHHSIPELTKALKRQVKNSNVHVLENNAIKINGFVFLGCTLWTDFRIWPDPRAAMLVADQGMCDFTLIKKKTKSGLFRPWDSVKIHAESVRWLKRCFSKHDPAKTIVVTHHAPSHFSIAPHKAGDVLNAAFASDLHSLIKESRIPLWIHGHTHYNVDYKIGKTRIYSNQRGYPQHVLRAFDSSGILDV
jgi:Icc-related predicted phosphoesterase